MLRDLQAAVAKAVMFDEPAAALAIIGDNARNAARLEIHRGNFVISLMQVLADTFPSVRRVLGFDAYNQIAAAFIAVQPPCKPQLLDWGGSFPDFLMKSNLAVDRRWLPDLARIDWARNEAHFAADVVPVTHTDIAAVQVDLYENLKFALLPSVRILTSKFAITAMWSAAMMLRKADFAADGPAEDVLVLRPWRIVTHRAITSGDGALLMALDSGATLATAAEAAYRTEPGFELTSALAAHLSGGTFGTFTTE